MSVLRLRSVVPSTALVLALLGGVLVVPQVAQAAPDTEVTAAPPVGHSRTARVDDADATSVSAVDPVSHRAYVHERRGTMPTSQVSVWDGDTMRRTGTVSGMRDLVGLQALTVDVVGRRLVGLTDTALVATDLRTGVVAWRTPITTLGAQRTMRADPQHGRLVLAGSSGVVVVDAASGTVQWTAAPGGRADVDATSGSVYVTTPLPDDANGQPRSGGTLRRYDADGALRASQTLYSALGIAVDGQRDRVYVGSQILDLAMRPIGSVPSWSGPERWVRPQFVDPATGIVWFRTDTSAGIGLTPWTPEKDSITLGDVVADVTESSWDPERNRFIGMADTAGVVDSADLHTWLVRDEPGSLTGTVADVVAAGVARTEAALRTVDLNRWVDPRFAVTGGTLPSGMRLDPATGIVSGTPTTPGTYRYAVTVTLNPWHATSAVFIRHVVAVDRIAGPDRFATTARASERAFPDGADVAYVASGRVFPDALSAAPAAVVEGGPVLLSEARSLPTATRAELLRLRPSRVVVVGGSVQQSVVDQVRSTLPTATVTRVLGATRYDVSRAVVAQRFPTGADSVYVATGAKFPDALVAGAAAGSAHAPLLLVPGDDPTADGPTLSALRALHPKRIVVAGGSVSPGIIAALGSVAHVDQLTGTDRYRAAIAVDVDRYPTAGSAFLVNGSDFPDALSATPLAGASSTPLYLAPPSCVPSDVLDAMGSQGVTRVTIVGGGLGSGPAALRRC
ncbi:cell wall-binding repeat-containing protein [Microbacterium sp. M1A1_1b]